MEEQSAGYRSRERGYVAPFTGSWCCWTLGSMVGSVLIVALISVTDVTAIGTQGADLSDSRSFPRAATASLANEQTDFVAVRSPAAATRTASASESLLEYTAPLPSQIYSTRNGWPCGFAQESRSENLLVTNAPRMAPPVHAKQSPAKRSRARKSRPPMTLPIWQLDK